MKRLTLFSHQISSRPITLDTLETLRIEAKGNVGTIWFNKEPSLNSISLRLAHEMIFVLAALDSMSEVKVIVIKSKHPKVFCAGADLKDIFLNSDHQADSPLFVHLERAFRQTNKPIISVVNGQAMGGGFEIALLTDLIVCSDKATFSLPELNLGIFPGLGGTQHLPRLVGSKVAMEKILLTRPIKGREAQ